MKKVTALCFSTVGFLVAPMLQAQAVPGNNPGFEAASLKLTGSSSARGMRGGPGSTDPEQITYSGISLKQILMKAYGVRTYQLAGPDWLDTALYDIRAKVAAGTTSEQFQIMLQNLLKERLDLALHHESREAAVYELVVGKNGSNFNQGRRGPDSLAAPPAARDAFPVLPAGHPGIGERGSAEVRRMAGRMQPVSSIAAQLEGLVERPILDKTGLNGNYDFKLSFCMDGLVGLFRRAGDPPRVHDQRCDNAGSLFSAIQAQLGLKLESKKDPIDVLVIDRVNKMPKEN